MKNYRKLTAVVLVLCMLCAALGGCGAEGTIGTTTSGQTTTTVAHTDSTAVAPTPGTGLPAVTDSALLSQKDTNPTPQAVADVPEAAKAAGFTKLAFADEFDSYDTFDFSGEGKAGYNWYVDRPYKGVTLTKEEIVLKDGVMTFAPKTCPSSIGLPTFSAKGKTGYTMHFGYAEARIRFSTEEISLRSETGRNGWPSFWGVSVVDVAGEKWDRVGELDILEAHQVDGNDPHSDVIYTGTLHDHVKLEDGSQQIATNVLNATGAMGIQTTLDSEWHTYAALWTEGYIAWYLDGTLMHSVRFADGEYPAHYYMDIDEPLFWNEESEPSLKGRTWPGAQTIMNVDHMVLFLGAHETWPIDVDWVRVWEAPAA
ncbi:MAG: family 16 glycosylhydrolase [Clostridia bacterium]|nr:family 16 glycosylhydrolase [Clostridia bacterium]